MRISRDKARERVEKALVETRPELKSFLWDLAWRGIRHLEARNLKGDQELAEQLARKMRSSNN